MAGNSSEVAPVEGPHREGCAATGTAWRWLQQRLCGEGLRGQPRDSKSAGLGAQGARDPAQDPALPPHRKTETQRA